VDPSPWTTDSRTRSPKCDVSTDNPGDCEFILRYVRHHEPDPVDAEHLALGVCESIRDGELTLTIEDDVVIMRTTQGDAVIVALADLR
jgi:hypothetical protein